VLISNVCPVVFLFAWHILVFKVSVVEPWDVSIIKVMTLFPICCFNASKYISKAIFSYHATGVGQLIFLRFKFIHDVFGQVNPIVVENVLVCFYCAAFRTNIIYRKFVTPELWIRAWPDEGSVVVIEFIESIVDFGIFNIDWKFHFKRTVLFFASVGRANIVVTYFKVIKLIGFVIKEIADS